MKFLISSSPNGKQILSCSFMNVQINQLVKSLLDKDSIDQCSLQELEQFADNNPHFGAAQLLLTKKLKAENHDRYNEQLQKTFLYFHNPLWVEHLLNETGGAEIKKAVKKVEIPVVTEPVKIEEPQIIPTTVAVVPTPVPEEKIEVPELITEPVVAAIAPDIEEKVDEPTAATSVTEEEEIAVPLPPLDIQPAPVSQKEELLFEPFHTVDYFASQGIKFKQEEKPVDKFGQQLKSFTDWLKTIRKTPVTDISAQTEVAAEKKVVQLAEHSLKEGEVLTEAMAEVWEKQGNMAKAIDLYSKLSLLEPAKSPYFAAKIDELKKQI
jgi:hypothetical protein